MFIVLAINLDIVLTGIGNAEAFLGNFWESFYLQKLRCRYQLVQVFLQALSFTAIHELNEAFQYAEAHFQYNQRLSHLFL